MIPIRVQRKRTKRLRTKRNGKDVTLFNGELVKNWCVV